MLSNRLVIIFYGLMALLGWALASAWLDLPVLVWGASSGVDDASAWMTHPLFALGVGAVVGLLSVAISQVLERTTQWARRLSDGFQDILGSLNGLQIFVIAAASSVGEEILFRGFLQQALALRWLSDFPYPVVLATILSSLVFGVMHIGPDAKTFWPWTVMAVVMGGVFGAIFWWTGGLEAPIIAHFTINFLNLTLMQSDHESSAS